MGYILRLPSINAPTNEEKIEQIRRYLYQTIKEINWALNTLDASTPQTVEANEVSASSTFALIKPMIIRSPEIINAYYNAMKDKFDDVYVAKVDYAKLEAWLKINTDSLEIGKMVNGSFVGLMKFTSSGDVIMEKPFKGTHKYNAVIGSIEEYVDDCDDGVTPIVTSSETTDMPEDFGDSVGSVEKVSENAVIRLTDLTTGSLATNVYTSGSWTGWKYLIPQ